MKLSFLKNYFYEIIFYALLIWVAGYSLANLTTKPRLWYDEGVNIEIAGNLARFGMLDMQIAPGVFSELAYTFQATGYPVTVPLAAFFKLFGFGATQARLYMLLWILAALMSIFFVLKRLMGEKDALCVLSLIATFASFFDNGRAVIGEIPGFVFVVWALYFWLLKTSYGWSGFFLGLAVATKPSVYITVFPAIVLALIILRDRWFTRSTKIALGALAPMLIRIILAMPDPFSLSSWLFVFRLFDNPFGTNVSVWTYAVQNILSLPRTVSLVYFSLFMILTLFAWFLLRQKKESSEVYRKFFIFSMLYILFAFLYYLKSPGWIRYLIGVELFIFILFVPALKKVINYFLPNRILIFYVVICLLVTIQLVHLFTGAKLYSSRAEEEMAIFINQEMPDKTVGIVNIPQIGALIESSRKFQMWKMVGVPQLGEDILLYRPRLDILIVANGAVGRTFQNYPQNPYYLLKTIGRYDIYAVTKE